MPRSLAAATSATPGSLMTGVPASVMTATSRPSVRMRRMRSRARSDECSWKLMSSACEPAWWSSGLLWRVSSAATSATRFSVSAARGERSPRLPRGVATTYRVPATSPRHPPGETAVEAGRLQHVAVLAGGVLQHLGGGPRHHDFRALEQLQGPVGQRRGQLLGPYHGVGRIGAARHAEQRQRLMRVDDRCHYFLRAPFGLAWKLS